jgi:GT2 family glycosyltransferase
MRPLPYVTIVIPAFNRVDVTRTCLRALDVSGATALRPQIIVADDASTDDTAKLAGEFDVEVVTNERNLGFIRNCNRAALRADGKHLVFLNNDTITFAGWLDWLLDTIESDDAIGAVGSKVVLPDGRLSEAGLLLARDGTGYEYGVFADRAASSYEYVRNVDCNGGCSLLVKTELFRNLGGFSERYVPAYMDDFDLSMAIWEAGYRVVYQPRSEIVHVNYISHGIDESERLYHINKPKFVERWTRQLASHVDITGSKEDVAIAKERAARRRVGRRSVLLVDERYEPDRLRELNRVRADGWAVMYAPLVAPARPVTRDLQQSGIEVVYPGADDTIDEVIFERLRFADAASFVSQAIEDRFRRNVRWPQGLPIEYDLVRSTA